MVPTALPASSPDPDAHGAPAGEAALHPRQHDAPLPLRPHHARRGDHRPLRSRDPPLRVAAAGVGAERRPGAGLPAHQPAARRLRLAPRAAQRLQDRQRRPRLHGRVPRLRARLRQAAVGLGAVPRQVVRVPGQARPQLRSGGAGAPGRRAARHRPALRPGLGARLRRHLRQEQAAAAAAGRLGQHRSPRVQDQRAVGGVRRRRLDRRHAAVHGLLRLRGALAAGRGRGARRGSGQDVQDRGAQRRVRRHGGPVPHISKQLIPSPPAFPHEDGLADISGARRRPRRPVALVAVALAPAGQPQSPVARRDDDEPAGHHRLVDVGRRRPRG
mmetsp:Transcript_14583/g.39749  ORF Transcript_14583/g.39749 Transcript_14583/m.39749 type:complete len:329 (-) Transcript_14583:194-1180(-)